MGPFLDPATRQRGHAKLIQQSGGQAKPLYKPDNWREWPLIDWKTTSSYNSQYYPPVSYCSGSDRGCAGLGQSA
jgi:hypothetical protein